MKDEKVHRNVYEHIELPVFVLDVDAVGGFVFSALNPACEKAAALPKEDVVGKRTDQISGFPKGPLEALGTNCQRCLKSGEAVVFEGTFPGRGQLAWWLTRLAPLRDEAGQIVQIIGSSTNIEQHRRTEEELRSRERQYRTLIENLPDIIARYDLDLRRTYVNPAWVQGIGLSAETVLNTPVSDTPGVRGRTFETYIAALRKVLDTGLPIYQDFSWVNARGEPLHLEYQLIPEYGPAGNVAGVLSIGRDITDRKLSEEALRKSEERYRLIAENTADTISIFDLDLNRLYVSPPVLRMRGFTVEEALRQQLHEVLTPESQRVAREVLSEQLDLEKSGEADPTRITLLELEEYCKDGSTVWVELAASFLRDAHNQVTGVLTVARDITQRKKAELRLIESERRFRSLAENSPDNIMLYDTEGRLLYINRNMETTVGIDFRSALGKIPHQYLNAEPPKDYLAKLYNVIKTGHPDELDVVVPNPAGELRTHHIRFVAERDSEGKIVGVLTIGRDITERQRAEETLRKLSHAMEQSPASIVITDTAGDIEYVNPRFTEVTGYSEAEVLGKNPRILKSGEVPPETYEQLWETITSGNLWRGEFRNRKKSGALYWESASISPILDTDGTTTHFIAVKEDISERKRLEEELRQVQKLEAVGQLAGGVAHDFNNMLSAIMGSTELALMDVAPSDPVRAHLEEIQAATRRSADLTRQLLAFARKQSIVPRVLDLNCVVSSMLNMLQRVIGEDIELAWVPAPELWSVKMDPGQIDQALANLSVNARDAITGIGKVTIETGNCTVDEAYSASHKGLNPGEYVLLAVSDDGCGMEEDTMSHMFEPFFTTKGLGRGTGLGLAIVYGIVKQNDGFIDVSSEPGKGTTFTIYFPRHEADEAETIADETVAGGMRGVETVLIVDDEEAVLKSCDRMLRRLGYTTLVAKTPTDAMLLLERHRNDVQLLITDVVLPEMSGRDLAERLVSIKPELKCLYMSGYTFDILTSRGAVGGGVHLLEKPISMKDLAAGVRKALDQDLIDGHGNEAA